MTTGQAAAALGVSAVTLQRWAHAGQVEYAYRTPGGHFRWQLDGPGGLRDQLRDRPPEPAAPSGTPDAAAPLRQTIVAAIVTSKLGVLVERRHDGNPPWTFPAGEAEPGESPEDTAIREAKEETGLLIKVSHVIGERLKHPATGRHLIYVAARPYQGTAVYVADEDELAEVRWVTLAEADGLLPGMFGPVRAHLDRTLR